jgi:hypothetical protein
MDKYLNMLKQNIRAILMAILLIALMAGAYSQDVAEYDKTISKLVGKLRQYPQRTRLMTELGRNFQLASLADQDLIRQLKETGQPDIWYRIYQANDRIAKRQELVKTLPQKTIDQCSITFVDNSRELEETKIRAARYSYAVAGKMLADSTPQSARLAYVELLKLTRLKANNAPDLDKLMRRAILLGSTELEFELYNRSGKDLTMPVVSRLNRIVWDYKRAKYGKEEGEPEVVGFKFTIKVVVSEIVIGPDQIKEMAYEEQRDIYRDAEVVDTINCLVSEFRQLKKATMSGRIDFYDNQIGQVVNTVPIKVESIFANAYGTLQGNPDAAGEETIRLLSSKKADYPSSEQMILDATEEFVKKATEIVLAL